MTSSCGCVGARLPARRNIHIRATQCGNGWAPEQLEGTLDVGPQDLKRTGDSCLTSGSEAVCISAPTQNGAGSQADCLDDIGAATNASVHQHLYPTVHGCYDFRQRSQASRNAVELASSVIRHDHGCSSFINRAVSVIAGKDALDDNRTSPNIVDPPQIFPSDRRAR